MEKRPWYRRARFYLFVVLGILVLLGVAAAPDLARMDISRFPSRDSWQVTDRVLQTLGITPGDYVADIGAGDGFFTFRLARAVGAEGKVFAVDVADDKISALEAGARSEGLSNVVVIKGKVDDPLLPDSKMDLVFLCHSYHHIEGREEYFRHLKVDLSPRGRVAVIDLSPTLLVRLLAPRGHWTALETIENEMRQSGYRTQVVHDFLPGQNYLIFLPN
jgi:ubiquinone/menaquinone biosynthesis C-methylase UbiE